MIPIVDMMVPCCPGSLTRSVQIVKAGKFRISRRHAELYSVQIVSSGSWGRARVTDAQGRVIWYQPSTFTGSFALGAGCENGIIVELSGTNAMNFTINFREQTEEMV